MNQNTEFVTNTLADANKVREAVNLLNDRIILAETIGQAMEAAAVRRGAENYIRAQKEKIDRYIQSLSPEKREAWERWKRRSVRRRDRGAEHGVADVRNRRHPPRRRD